MKIEKIKFFDDFNSNDDLEINEFNSKLKKLKKKLSGILFLDEGKRIDGRDLTTVRDIKCEVGFLNNVHGSALFTRGETQALVITTLGTGQDEQIKDTLDGDFREKFMLHYNFPPFSVNEVGRIGSTGRREIGHGKLAWRSVNPLFQILQIFLTQ